MAGLLAYSFQPKKPNIKIIRLDKQALMQICGYLTFTVFDRLLMQVYVGNFSGKYINIKTEVRKLSNLQSRV
uniref:hypothetical protein n=1 Tax=Candidatus Enterovibrio escicola TaxID=1927127 RepID=UPI001CC22048|nr:hypothetical protein [Candidatus Enterovibrio escacola]